jgi:hypothetical protein
MSRWLDNRLRARSGLQWLDGCDVKRRRFVTDILPREPLPRGPVRLVTASMLAFALAAATLPDPIFARLFDEYGLIESLTLAAWLVAAVMFAREAIARGGAVAWLAAPVCVAAAAREADLHLRLTGSSILKLEFYGSGDFAVWEKLLALAAVLPLAVALGALLVLLVQRLRREGAGSPAMRLLLLTLVLLVLSKLFDRSPSVFRDWYGVELPSAARRFLRVFEEGIELLLPVLFVAAFRMARNAVDPRGTIVSRAKRS